MVLYKKQCTALNGPVNMEIEYYDHLRTEGLVTYMSLSTKITLKSQ